MATITTISNGQNGATVRGSLNTNFSNLNTEHGNLATLTTTSKTNFVGAINEVDADVATRVQSIYGEMWSTVETAGTLTLSSSVSYSAIASNLGLKIGSGITHDTGALKIGTAGTYLVTFTCSINSNTDATGVDLVLLKNGTALVNGKIVNVFETGGYTKSVSSSCIETFALNDLIKIGFRRNVPVTFNLTVYNYHITITKV